MFNNCSDKDKQKYTELIGAVKQLNHEKKTILNSRAYSLGKSFSNKQTQIKKLEFAEVFRSANRKRRFKISQKYVVSKNTRDSHDTSDYFFGERIAVYTCITGGYDLPQEPLILPDNCDYYIITDSNIDESSKWKKIDINNIQFEEDGLTNPMKNRYVKMHPDKLFPDYDYSLYIDGSIRICTDVTEYINRISNYGVSFYDHNLRDCVYDEIMACIALEKADKNELLQHKDYLISSGMPEKYGLVACGIIARQHNNEMCKKLMNEWWYEYSYHVKRDQLCLPLVLYKNKVLPVDIALLGNNMYNDDSFEFYKHTV